MMNGYAMSGWGWLLMTLGILGFWALVAVVAVALLRRPGPPDQQPLPDQQPPPGAQEILAERLARGELDPRSTASASRHSRRPPTGHDPRHLRRPSRSMGPNGGWGSYSIASWTIRAVGSSVSRATRARAMSMPADTPAEVMNLPSSTHRLGR